MHHSDGRVQQVPPIDNRFQPEQVLLRTDTVPPEIHIAFRWAGERTLFGVRERVKHDDDEARAVGGTTADELASMIVISLEENLLACGHGIENAIRDLLGDVTWLRWNIKPSAR